MNPIKIFTTVSLTWGKRYSGGMIQSRLRDRTLFTHLSTVSGSTPPRILLPHSMVSGRSVTSRMVTFATRSKQHSSWTVPLSLMTHRAFLSRLMKLKKPKGSRKRILFLFMESMPKAFILIRSMWMGADYYGEVIFLLQPIKCFDNVSQANFNINILGSMHSD